MNQDQRKYWLIGGGIALLFLLGNQGFRDWVSNLHEKRRVERELIGLRADHDHLTRELTLIQQDPSYTEYLIRKNLGYVKKGEVEYRLMKPSPDAKR